jgi:hypothetical protein
MTTLFLILRSSRIIEGDTHGNVIYGLRIYNDRRLIHFYSALCEFLNSLSGVF